MFSELLEIGSKRTKSIYQVAYCSKLTFLPWKLTVQT